MSGPDQPAAAPGTTGVAAPPTDVAVVIPCYNEALTIAAVVRDFARVLPHARIYVFDNNSTDGTAAVAAEAGATVVHSPRQGKGNVLRHMAETVDADAYILVDGDDTYAADAAPAMLQEFARAHLDMLVGARLSAYESGSFRPYHHLGNQIIAALVNLLYRCHLTDVLSGYRVLSHRFVALVRLRRGGFEVETEYTLQALTKGLAVAEMPVPYRSRPPGSFSKLSTWNDGFRILRCIVLLFKDYKPLVFFTTLAVLVGLASLLFGSVPIADYIEFRYVLHVPLAILAAALGLLSVIFLTVGLVLDTIAHLHQETIDLWKHQFGKRR